MEKLQNPGMDFEWDYIPQCGKGHNLSWSKSYSQVCGNCEEISSLSRWMCQSCKVSFCVKCVKPPVCGLKCPLGHTMNQKNLQHNSCDCCRKSISGTIAYRDDTCDFDLCNICYKEYIRED